jgi:hypothetical protein
MSARVRKLVGLVGILAFLLFYIGLIANLARYVPKHGIWQAAFFIPAGALWGVPILPLISWMGRGR